MMTISPITEITALSALWNEEPRVGRLVKELFENFEYVVIVVQDSDDRTAEVAEAAALTPNHVVLRDVHHGYGEASFPLGLRFIKTPWTFVISGDEFPGGGLLGNLETIVGLAAAYDGVYLPMHSFIEDYDFTGEQEAHLRLFRTKVGWPGMLHSRPMTDNTVAVMDHGWIEHRRSLDEMMWDYLRYYKRGQSNPQWVAHNRMMMHDACVALADREGWKWIEAHEWWPQVAAIAFPRGHK